MVIFGATGDLARRKLVPALYNLAVSGHLAAAFGIVGVAKSGLPPDEFARDMREAVERSRGPSRSTWKSGRTSPPECAT